MSTNSPEFTVTLRKVPHTVLRRSYGSEYKSVYIILVNTCVPVPKYWYVHPGLGVSPARLEYIRGSTRFKPSWCLAFHPPLCNFSTMTGTVAVLYRIPRAVFAIADRHSDSGLNSYALLCTSVNAGAWISGGSIPVTSVLGFTTSFAPLNKTSAQHLLNEMTRTILTGNLLRIQRNLSRFLPRTTVGTPAHG